MSFIRYAEGQILRKCKCGQDALYLCDQAKGVSDCCDALLCNACVKVPKRWAEPTLEQNRPEEAQVAVNKHLCADHLRHNLDEDNKTFLDTFDV